MIKLLFYPFIATRMVTEMILESGRAEIRRALRFVLVDTLADTKEINDLKAELAVLRAEVSEVKYEAEKGKPRTKARAT